MLHTSGTTKKPKIVPLTNGNISSGALCIASTLQLRAADICLNIMPLFHIHGLIVNILASAVSGASVVCTRGMLQGEQFLGWLQEGPEQPTWYSAVPTMHQIILGAAEAHCTAHGQAPPHSLVFIRNCSAALLPVVSQRIEQVLGVQVVPTYAMTESMPICSNPRVKGDVAERGGCKLRSVGLSGGPEVVVLRDPPENVERCAVGEEGHVCVRGAMVTKGYEYRQHMGGVDPNIEGFTPDGFLCTGDKG